MLALLLIVVAVVFAFQAIRARGLIASALWLAGVSALTALVLFLYGAHQVAVIELSVGTGLVTVLFVLAINIAGDNPMAAGWVVPLPFAIGVSLLFVLVLGWMVLSALAAPAVSTPATTVFSDVFWQSRGLDVLVQVVLIFSGVLGFLGLLAEVKAPLGGSLAESVSSGRDLELKALEEQLLEGQESPE
jgi:NADH:ubiquinone oxidoreductase subunit 6 (subunit J)